jgi:hypothetical protein
VIKCLANLTWRREQIQLSKRCVFRTMSNVYTLWFWILIHHRQNPVDSTCLPYTVRMDLSLRLATCCTNRWVSSQLWLCDRSAATCRFLLGIPAHTDSEKALVKSTMNQVRFGGGTGPCHHRSILPFRAYAPFPALLIFSLVLWGCSVPPAILPRSPQLWQNGDLSVLSSVREQRKVGWVGSDGHVFFGQIFPGEKGSVKRSIVVM